MCYVQPEWAGHLAGAGFAGAGFALRCWLCSASADIMMGHVCGTCVTFWSFLRVTRITVTNPVTNHGTHGEHQQTNHELILVPDECKGCKGRNAPAQ